jgi:membrane-bound lytic murein transglycosylase D
MASYNWGENRVIKLIRRMAANPWDRNFWNLLINFREKIPKETYDYVFYIFSAAVIGQKPKLFGFDIENPLATVDLGGGVVSS